MPRFHSGRAHRSRSGALPRFGQARRHARHSGMAKFLFQIADVRAAALSRARFVYSAHETEEHVALDDGRRTDHPPWLGILRLTHGLNPKTKRDSSTSWRGPEMVRRKACGHFAQNDTRRQSTCAHQLILSTI